ncbi:carbohydrate porin [Methylobacterium sp. JK268]
MGAPTAASAQAPSAAAAFNGQAEERSNPERVETAASPVRSGPLAPFANQMAEHGLTFDFTILNFYQANPSAGLRPGQQSNATYFVLSMTADMQKIAGLSGGTINFTQFLFGNVRNLNMAGDIGDSTLGYQPPYNPGPTRLSLLTYQQKLLDDQLVVEVGRTHPIQYYALPPCGSINSCFLDLLVLNGGFSGPLYGVWGGNVAYQISPTTYVQAGAFSVSPNTTFLSGYEWGYERQGGPLILSELGYKTDYTTSAYPSRFSVTGFFNAASHEDNFKTVLGTSKGLNPSDPVLQRSGTSGLVLTGVQTVWRADGGLEKNPTPTALSAYIGAGQAFDPTIPIQTNVFCGVLLQAPDQGRPLDTYGLKFNWQRLAADYTRFLADANLVSGGTGAPYARDKFVLEANAHFELGRGAAFEPVVQYVINPNSYWDPYTSRRARDGFYVGGTLLLPLGGLLGLTPG